MYNLKCRLENINREPWNISLEDRKQKLLRAIIDGKKTAVMIYNQSDTSTFRYRCYNVMQILEDSDYWESIYFFMNEIECLNEFLHSVNLVILVRLPWTHDIDYIIQKAHSLRIPVLFDIDDLVCSLRNLKLVTNTLNVHFGSKEDYDFWFAYISRLEYTASLVDGFIVTNDFLGKKLQEQFNKPYGIVINSLNKEQFFASHICIKQKKSFYKPFTIGYFSGTPSHINDFKIVAPELLSILEDYPEIVLRVVGFMDFPSYMQDFINKKRIIFSPLVDFVQLQKEIAEVDLNIVPLVQNQFTNCKSELKFFEASAVNTLTIASPIYSYAHSIENNKTGFLCEAGQWYDCIKNTYNNIENCKIIVQNANKYCLNTYTGDNFKKIVENTYNYFSNK